jgi:hypothetical protein
MSDQPINDRSGIVQPNPLTNAAIIQNMHNRLKEYEAFTVEIGSRLGVLKGDYASMLPQRQHEELRHRILAAIPLPAHRQRDQQPKPTIIL